MRTKNRIKRILVAVVWLLSGTVYAQRDTILLNTGWVFSIDKKGDNLIRIIQNNLIKGSDIIGSKTVDLKPSYPDKVFRELCVNACIHRNYSIDGSRIRVFMFSDRLEFYSPGRLPNTVTIPKMMSGVSYSNNPVILKFMENLRYVDKLGRGIPMVLQESIKLGKKLMQEEIGEEFKVTLEL